MHCTICNSTLPVSDTNGCRAVCDKCSTTPKTTPTSVAAKTGNKKVNRRRNNQNEAGQKRSPQQIRQTIQSARSVARAWKETLHADEAKSSPTRFFRIDNAHPSEDSAELPATPSFIANDATAQIASIRNAVSFGLLVFLIGQALMMGAFLVGHYPAWSIGLLFSIGGITVSLLSVNEALRRLENKVSKIAHRHSETKASKRQSGR